MGAFQSLKRQFKTKRRWLKRRWHTLPLWYNEPDFIFIHINKTGGSSIEKALNLPFEHLTAQEKKAEVGAEKWQEKFTFAVVRNPFDKVCSHYRFRVKTNQTQLQQNPIDFKEWVHKCYVERDPYYHDQAKMFMPQMDWLCDDSGQLMVDQVYHFESLAEDFQALCEKFQLDASLPHLKSSGRVDYRSYYDAPTRDVVAKSFAKDLEAFHYRFDT